MIDVSPLLSPNNNKLDLCISFDAEIEKVIPHYNSLFDPPNSNLINDELNLTQYNNDNLNNAFILTSREKISLPNQRRNNNGHKISVHVLSKIPSNKIIYLNNRYNELSKSLNDCGKDNPLLIPISNKNEIKFVEFITKKKIQIFKNALTYADDFLIEKYGASFNIDFKDELKDKFQKFLDELDKRPIVTYTPGGSVMNTLRVCSYILNMNQNESG